MSVVFGLLRNDYAIIATDTRIMLLDTLERLYADEYEKIYKTQCGWVSGVGVGELIRNMTDKLDDQINKIRYEEILKLSSKYSLEDLQKTLIIFSKLDNEEQLQIYYIGNEYSLTKVPKNTLIGMQPADIDDAEWNRIYKICLKKLQNSSLDIYDDIKFIAEGIYIISKKCQSVSEICDMGILLKDGSIKRVRNECKKIINELNV